jgi:hypothetical protein
LDSPIHIIRTDGVSIRVPVAWRLGQQVVVSRIRAAGPNWVYLIPYTTGGGPHHPYVGTAWVAGPTTLAAHISELSANGAFYRVTLRVPSKERPALSQALRSLTLPPVATVTDAVHLAQIERRWTIISRVGRERWILAAGLPATAQQGWFLLKSSDSGRRWSIETDNLDHSGFPSLEGMAALRMVSRTEGIIAEVSGFSADLLVYRTTNGGHTWRLARLAYPAPPNTTAAPIIRVVPPGRLVISVDLTGGGVADYSSSTRGRTWHASPSTHLPGKRW